MASTSTANPPMAPPTAAPILALDDGGAFDSWATGAVGIEVDDGIETKLVLVLVLEAENPGGIYDDLAFNII